ncbi:MAG: hypothetical protein K0S33_677 [Bacteroidetes bacterium]|nr:hypothetical protein [Bacteroidota bacterium]
MTDATGNVTTTIEFEVTMQKRHSNGDVIDASVSGRKLKIGDAILPAHSAEEWLTITVEQGETDGTLPKVTVNSHSKLTKADAG